MPGSEPTNPAAPAVAPGTAPISEPAGTVVVVTTADEVAGCQDLGQKDFYTSTRGARGRDEIRSVLGENARARGASHVRYSDYVNFGNSQRERAHFYLCRITASIAQGAGPAREPGIAAERPPLLLQPAVGGQFELIPAGALNIGPSGNTAETDVVTAYGVSFNVEYLITPFFAAGVNPGLIFGLKTDTAPASFMQFDLRARVRLGRLVGDGLGAYVYGSAGVSAIAGPNDAPTSRGAIVGGGVGICHQVERSRFVTAELGYQLGFQSMSINGNDAERSSRLFHLGLGAGWYL